MAQQHEYMRDTITSLKESESFPLLDDNNKLKIYVVYMSEHLFNDTHLFSLDLLAYMLKKENILSPKLFSIIWILKAIRRGGSYQNFETFLEKRLIPNTSLYPQLDDEDINRLQERLNYVVERVPTLRKYKRKYKREISAVVSEKLVPRDDPDMDTTDLGDIVSSFFFNGKKNRSKSGRKKVNTKLKINTRRKKSR